MPLPPYTLHLGPLDFVCPLERVSKALGDAVEAVGSAVTPAERRPRTVKLKLPVEGDPHTEADPKAAGDRLMRQVTQLLENRRWLSHGLYLHWEVGHHLAAWVILGGGDLSEQDPGVSFGMYELDLGDVYIVGRPGTHRPGRRLDLADRRNRLVPRDTRGLLYTDDFAAATLPAYPLILPAGVESHRSSSGQPRANLTTTLHDQGADNVYLFTAWEAVDGEVITYNAERFQTSLEARAAPRFIDDRGAVKAWDMSLGLAGDSSHPAFTNTPLATAGLQDLTPDTAFGWERLYGPPERQDRYIALENGIVRCRWLGRGTQFAGGATGQGLVLERWDEDYPGGPRYRPECRFGFTEYDDGAHSNAAIEATIVELTQERGLLEVRNGYRCLRVILQRGWVGPRLECYFDLDADGDVNAFLEWEPVNPNADSTVLQPASGPFHFVRTLNTTRTAPDTARAVTVAPAADTYTYDLGTANLNTGDYAGVTISQPDAAIAAGAPNLVALQVGLPFPTGTPERDTLGTPQAIGALSLVDARSVPVLVAR